MGMYDSFNQVGVDGNICFVSILSTKKQNKQVIQVFPQFHNKLSDGSCVQLILVISSVATWIDNVWELCFYLT